MVVLTRRRRWVLLITVVALAVAAVGLVALRGCREPVCSPVTYPPGGVRITTGGVGGVYQTYGVAVQKVLTDDLPDLRVEVESSQGSVDNIGRLAHGTADLGFISADTAFLVPQEEAEAHRLGRIKAIARVYDEYIQVVVPDKSPIRSIADLQGKRVSVGATGSSVEVTARRLLNAAAMDDTNDILRSNLGVADSARALTEGRIDAFFWVGGLPTVALATLAANVKIRLLPLDRYVDALRIRYGVFYQSATVPTGTYAGIRDTRTIAVPSYLLVDSDLDDDLVFRFTSALFNHRTRLAALVPSGRVLDIRSAINTTSIPLHPGAVRYYRSVKP